MNRQIVLDTETTGLSTAEGHRIIEIGCVELINRRLTGQHYHQYINPEREVDEGALEVHGISNEFLADKPVFTQVIDDFLKFVDGAELVIHNAAFDIGFLDYELSLLDGEFGKMEARCSVTDSLVLAREMHPGQKNNLDALCKRYDINNAHRDLHGALLDAEILADVYLAMTGGQADLLFAADTDSDESSVLVSQTQRKHRAPLKVILPTAEEMTRHEAHCDLLDKAAGGPCVYRQSATSTMENGSG